jgi:enterochelin esterase-like enzyme
VELLTRIETSRPSRHLQRQVRITLLLPPGYYRSSAYYPVLFLHDGQDINGLKLEKTLNRMFQQQLIPPLIVAGIHAGHDRRQEYGVAARPDFAGRGAKAAFHAKFLTEELRPFLIQHYRIKGDAAHHFLAGCSLGGLSAFDITWRHPEYFSRAGIFSGSFWWRSHDLGDGYDDATHRIMHAEIRGGIFQKDLKFWFQAGTEDEISDRNQNGIIDAIDDTLDLISELEEKGYRRGSDIVYVEVVGGRHNQETWGKVMPDFLSWLCSQ